MRFLRHLARLRFNVFKRQVAKSSTQSLASRLRRLVAFGLVGATGMVVNTLVLWLLADVWDQHYLLAAVDRDPGVDHLELVVDRGVRLPRGEAGTALSRGIKFYLLNNLALLVRLPLLALLVDGLNVNLLVANVITLMLLFLVRFVIADAAIYARPDRARSTSSRCGSW